jgi:SAM-dependent methyltransferase
MNRPLALPPNFYNEAADLFHSDSFQTLRNQFIQIINRHQVPFAENILKTNDWINYCYYCCLVHFFKPDPSALIIDWGGLYGHITKMLQTMGYPKVFNYLLHPVSYYSLFKDRLQIPTLWGKEPNRLNLETSSVDVFISSGVLEHVREDGEGREELVLREIHRVLKEEGLFFIWNLPSKLGTSELLAIASKKWHHQNRYGKKEISSLLDNAGFEILYMDKHKFFPGAVMNLFERWMTPTLLLNFDSRLSHLFPFNLLARDFVLVSRKRK